MKLINETKIFNISTTGLDAKYNDSGEASLRLCVNFTNKISQSLIELRFLNVAELRCKTINFYEAYHTKYEIVPEPKGGSKHISGFYRICDSVYLEEVKGLYDPRNDLGLNHYLVTGGDGFCEVIASDYSVIPLSPSD